MISTELTFEFETNDWIAFQEDFLFHSKTYQGSIKESQLSLPAIFLAVVLLSIVLDGFQGWSTIIVYVILSILWFFYAPKISFNAAIKQTKSMIEEGKNQNILCEHYFIINENGIFFESDFHKENLLWEGVEKLNETQKHYFIYITSLSAFIIPKEKISQENIRVIDTLIRNYKKVYKK